MILEMAKDSTSKHFLLFYSEQNASIYNSLWLSGRELKSFGREFFQLAPKYEKPSADGSSLQPSLPASPLAFWESWQRRLQTEIT